MDRSTSLVFILTLLLIIVSLAPLTYHAASDELPPGVTIQRVTASGLWMCNVVNGQQGECAILSMEFYNVGQLVEGYGAATVTCIWKDRKTPLDVTGMYFTGGPNGKVYFDYAGYTTVGQLVNGEYITFGDGPAHDIPIANPDAFDGFGDVGLEVSVSAPEILPTCVFGTGLRYTITTKATGFPTPEVTVTGDERVEDMGGGVYQIDLCSNEQVELEIISTSGEHEQKEQLFLPMETAPAVSLIVLEGPTLVPALSSSGDVYRYVLQASVYGYPVPELEWVNATPAEKDDTTVTVTVPAGKWLWEFPTVTVTAKNSVGSDSDSVKLPVESLIKDSGAGFSDVSGQVMICPPDKDPDDEDNWEMYDERTMLTMKILRGTRIRTGSDSEATIGFADMATFVLKPDSTIVIVKPPEQQGKLSLVAGHIWANVKSMMKDGSMDIEMNQAVAGIKGTIFECIEDGVTSTLIVHEGEVEFTSYATGETITVSSGEMGSATAGGLGQKTTHDGTIISEGPGPTTLPPSSDPGDIGDEGSDIPPTSSGTTSGSSSTVPPFVPPSDSGSGSSFPLAYALGGIVLLAIVAALGISMSKRK